MIRAWKSKSRFASSRSAARVSGLNLRDSQNRFPIRYLPKDLRGRIDLRDIPLVTIDGEDARDFDDAVYCEPFMQARASQRLEADRRDGRREPLREAGDALDIEAQNRSTSVYFPRRVIPMLPEKLSNGLCSLKPEVDRLVHGVRLRRTTRAHRTRTSFILRSCIRMHG